MPKKDTTPNLYGEMRELSHERFYTLWQRAKAGEPLEDEDARTVQVMRDHPEYFDTWEHANEFLQEQVVINGVNPFLHLLIHSTVENQIARNDPPEARAVVEYKTSCNIPRHDVIHEIGNEVTKMIWTVLHDNKPADNDAYRRKLAKMLPRSKRNLPN